MAGRLHFDIFQYLKEQDTVKTRTGMSKSYSLNAVCKEHLGPDVQKEDLPFTLINKLQNGTDDDRKKLALYCLKVWLIKLSRAFTDPFVFMRIHTSLYSCSFAKSLKAWRKLLIPRVTQNVTTDFRSVTF